MHRPEDVGGGCGGGRALPVDHDDLVPVREVEDDGYLATEAEVRDLRDRRGERCGDAGVHGVPATGQHPHARLCGEVAPGGDDADLANHLGPVGRRPPDRL